MIYRNVLVISESPEYLDEVSDVLAAIDVLGVLVQDAEEAAQALQEGFEPEVVLLDPSLVAGQDAEAFVRLLRASPKLGSVAVLAISTPPPPGARARGPSLDRAGLLTALEKIDLDRHTPSPSP